MILSFTWEIFSRLILLGLFCWVVWFWCRDFSGSVITGRPIHRSRIKRAEEALGVLKSQRVLGKQKESLKKHLEKDILSNREALKRCRVSVYFLQFFKVRYVLAFAFVFLIVPWFFYTITVVSYLTFILWPVGICSVYFTCKPRMRSFIYTCLLVLVVLFYFWR